MAAEWFCRIRGQLRGPLSAQDLKALATGGQLAPDSLVRQGMSGAWVKAGRVKGLFQAGADAKDRPATTPETLGASSTVVGLSELGGGLGDLEDLPAVAGGSTGTAGSQMGASVLPIGEFVPMGTIIPSGQAVFSTPRSDDDPPFIDPGRTASGHRDITRRDVLPNSKPGEFSKARVISVAIVAVVLSFLGLCFVLFPIVPVVLGVVGIILALRALLLGGRRHTGTMALAAAAIVLGLGAAGGGLHALLSGNDPQGRFNEQISSWLSGKPSAARAPQVPTTHWFQAPEEVAVTGDLHIQITGAGVGPLPGREAASRSGEDGGGKVYLMVKVRLQNISKRKVDYLSYSGTIAGAQPPEMRDDLGSNYRRVTTPGLTGQLHKESLYPGDAKIDMIVFERPVPNYRQLELTLPGSAFGETEPVRFQIPRSMVNEIVGAAPAPARPKVVEIRSEGEDKVPVESPQPAAEN